MPISGPSSYLPTTDLFIAHWSSANVTLGAAGPVTLADGVAVEDLMDLRAQLEGERAAVEARRNDVEFARATIEALKAALLARLGQFSAMLGGVAPASPFFAMRPKAFSQSDGMGKVLPPLDDVADVWARYNTSVAPQVLTLVGGYTLAQFEADLEALKAAYSSYGSGQNGLFLARSNRNSTQDRIRAILVQYRQRIPGTFAADSPILATLPRLTPPEGSTPDAVVLSGSWNTTTGQAELVWSPVEDDSVSELELRATAGAEFDAEDESVVATIAPDAPATWSGTWGLLAPGAAASFKVYCITPEGNERGSNAVTVERPG